MNTRLENLRQTLRLQWGELADRLDMSRAMLDFVRKNQRNLSFRALSRLEDAERSAGIAPPPMLMREAPPAHAEPEENGSIIDAHQELREIGSLLRELCVRVDRLEKRLNNGENVPKTGIPQKGED